MIRIGQFVSPLEHCSTKLKYNSVKQSLTRTYTVHTIVVLIRESYLQMKAKILAWLLYDDKSGRRFLYIYLIVIVDDCAVAPRIGPANRGRGHEQQRRIFRFRWKPLSVSDCFSTHSNFFDSSSEFRIAVRAIQLFRTKCSVLHMWLRKTGASCFMVYFERPFDLLVIFWTALCRRF